MKYGKLLNYRVVLRLETINLLNLILKNVQRCFEARHVCGSFQKSKLI